MDLKSNIKGLVLFILLSAGFSSCAQTRTGIVRSYAYYIERTPGNIPDFAIEAPVEGNKDPRVSPVRKVDTSIVIYIETKNKLISWDTAWQKDQPYLITAFAVTDIPTQPGFAKEGEQILLSPAKGNFLWQLQLSPLRPKGGRLLEITHEKLTLKGRYLGKRISWKTGSLSDLIPFPSY